MAAYSGAEDLRHVWIVKEGNGEGRCHYQARGHEDCHEEEVRFMREMNVDWEEVDRAYEHCIDGVLLSLIERFNGEDEGEASSHVDVFSGTEAFRIELVSTKYVTLTTDLYETRDFL